MNEKLLDSLKVSDISEQNQAVAETIGIQNYIQLCKENGGTSIYLPTVKELVKNVAYRKILAESKLFNRKQLATMYGVSESTVYNIQRKRNKK